MAEVNQILFWIDMPDNWNSHSPLGIEYQIDRYVLTATGFTPGGSVKVQYIQSNTHTLQEEEHRRINNNEQHNKTEEYSNRK